MFQVYYSDEMNKTIQNKIIDTEKLAHVILFAV